jgi:hypothetical protein
MPDDIIREVYAALLCRRLTKPLQTAVRLIEVATGDRPRNTIELAAFAADYLGISPEAVLAMTAGQLLALLQRAADRPQSSPTLEQDMDNLTDVRLTKAEARAVKAFAAAARELSSDTADPPTIRAAFDYIVSCGDYGYDHDDFEGFKKALLRGRKKIAQAMAREPRSAVGREHFYGR